MHGMAVRALTILPPTTSWPDWQTSGHRASKQCAKHFAACRGDLQPTSALFECCKYTTGVSDQSTAHHHQEWQITHAGCLRCTSPQRPPAADSPSLPSQTCKNCHRSQLIRRRILPLLQEQERRRRGMTVQNDCYVCVCGHV